MNNHTTTTLSCARMKEEFTLKNATHYGGANLLLDYALNKLNLAKMFESHLTMSKRYNAKYSLVDTMTTYVLGNILGSGRIFHMETLENDSLLLAKTGLVKLPDYTLYYTDLDRFDDELKTKLVQTFKHSLKNYYLFCRKRLKSVICGGMQDSAAMIFIS